MSTAGQICLLFMLYGSESNLICTEYLLAHGVFKSSCFMLGGIILHTAESESQLARKRMEWIGSTMVPGILCLCIAWSSALHISTGRMKDIAYESRG